MSSMTQGIIVLVGSFALLLLMGVEISYTLGISAVLTCLYMHINLQTVFQTIFYKMSNYSLLAVPCFMLMGEFMSIGSMADSIEELATVLVGWMPGGLAMVNVVDSMFFGGVSGSSVADVSSLGCQRKNQDTPANTITVPTAAIMIPATPLITRKPSANRASARTTTIGRPEVTKLLSVTLM